MKSFKARVVVITGAGHGIGRAFALEAGRRGSKLAICDLSEEGLLETEKLCKNAGYDTLATVVDVSDRSQIEAWCEEVVAHFGEAHAIVNNAGVSMTASVSDMSYEDFEWLMNVNFWGVVYGTKAFLPHLIASGDGHVVNISSILGIIAVPYQAAYNASKFAVKGFTEALSGDLAFEKLPVNATVVHPGFIATDIARRGRYGNTDLLDRSPDELAEEFDAVARTSPEKTARVIAQAMLKNRRRVLVGTDAKLIETAHRLVPTRYLSIVIAGIRRWLK